MVSTPIALSNEDVFYKTSTITSGTETEVFNLIGGVLCEVYIPAAIGGTTFQIHKSTSEDGTFSPLIDPLGRDNPTAGDPYEFTYTGDAWAPIPADVVKAAKIFKIVFTNPQINKTIKISYRAFA